MSLAPLVIKICRVRLCWVSTILPGSPCEYLTAPSHASSCAAPCFLGIRYQGYDNSTCARVTGCKDTRIHADRECHMSPSRSSRPPPHCGTSGKLMKLECVYTRIPRDADHRDLDRNARMGHRSSFQFTQIKELVFLCVSSAPWRIVWLWFGPCLVF